MVLFDPHKMKDADLETTIQNVEALTEPNDTDRSVRAACLKVLNDRAAIKTPPVLIEKGGTGPARVLQDKEREMRADMVNHPPHYTKHPSGIECIEITRHMSFNLGNVVKYVWRADLKNGIEDLEKAQFYIKDEIAKFKKEQSNGNNSKTK